ncbi:LacI family DNA-binding transcriptional regulator [Actinoplanes subtropicus]|uniref:LacI family DNA-binding transcriptional regulator n=1 Tax=Actinoplanes subtropicus TaxID=543632 RepID=UPI000B0077CE|nr:LacI family DNA-binding transcriptional regulator [Actinoplanes subtropicus]
MARPTMSEVATLAGVGLKTVSRVVNGEGRVSRETRARVEAAIAQVGYRRNEVARSMRNMRSGQSTDDLGLMLGDLTNPFFAAVAAAVIAEARGRGYAVVLASADEDPQAERGAIDGLLGRQVAGLLLVPGGRDYSYLKSEIDHGTPVVFVDRPGGGLEADEVVLDNAAGARMAVTHLAAYGHRRIGAIVAPSRWATTQRLRGFREAMKTEVGAVDPSLVRRLSTGSVAEAERAARGLLAMSDPPTAIFATTGFMTQGLLRALGRRRDVAVVGFDDFPMADMLPVPVTVVAGDPTALGTAAAQTLFARIDGWAGPQTRQVIRPTLLPRGSGEIRPRQADG